MNAVLVVGGAGIFGSLLIDGILSTTNLHVIIAGRNLARVAAKATAFQKRFRTQRVRAIVLDGRSVTPQAIKATGASVVVDAAGPYQASCFSLASAAIESGLDYVDLADARGFVATFPEALGNQARAAGVLALA